MRIHSTLTVPPITKRNNLLKNDHLTSEQVGKQRKLHGYQANQRFWQNPLDIF